MLKALVSALPRHLRLQAASPSWACTFAPGAQQSRGLKETTGLVGLAVDPEARANLLAASQDVLAAVKEKIPGEAQYRANVEATFHYWIEQLNSSAADEEVEERLEFQLEELTVMAREELEVVDHMALHKPWDCSDGHAPEEITEQEVAERLDAEKK